MAAPSPTRRRRPDGRLRHPQAALGQPGALLRRRRRRDPAAARRRAGTARPGGADRGASRWAPPSPPTPCWSARASRPCWSYTDGFRDALRIAYQNRPAHLRPPRSCCPSSLYDAGDRGRTSGSAPHGERPAPLDLDAASRDAEQARADGFRAVAVVLLHGYRHPAHERAIGAVAAPDRLRPGVGCSHEVSPLMKLVPRGDTTVVDAYLSPDPAPLRRARSPANSTASG